jgi:uncharacterized protein involved in response to NO
MKQPLIESLQDWTVLALTGIGITLAPHQFFGGLFMALAAAMAARHLRPEKDQREVWLVLLMAFLAAVVAAELVQAYWPTLPVQLVMMAAGFLSRFAVEMTLDVAIRLQRKTDTIADRVLDRVLPDIKDKDEGQ